MDAGFKVRPGLAVIAEERRYQIEKVVDLESVLARDLETGDIRRLRFNQLVPASALKTEEEIAPAEPDPQQISEADWQRVAYSMVADKYLGPLVSRLSGVNQPVIRSRTGFSASC